MSNKPTRPPRPIRRTIPAPASAPDDAAPPPTVEIPLVDIPKRYLSRLDILESEDLATEDVDVPEWGGTVTVRALSGTERDAYEGDIFSMRGQGKGVEYNLSNIRAKLSARTIVDHETGARVFTDADIVKLGLKSAAALDRVFSAAQRLSRLTAADVKELADQLGNGKSAASGSA